MTPHQARIESSVLFTNISKKRKKDEVKLGKGLCRDDMEMLPIMS